MKTNKLPSDIKLCLFDILSEDTSNRVFDELQSYLISKYGYNRGFGYKEEMTLCGIEW